MFRPFVLLPFIAIWISVNAQDCSSIVGVDTISQLETITTIVTSCSNNACKTSTFSATAKLATAKLATITSGTNWSNTVPLSSGQETTSSRSSTPALPSALSPPTSLQSSFVGDIKVVTVPQTNEVSYTTIFTTLTVGSDVIITTTVRPLTNVTAAPTGSTTTHSSAALTAGSTSSSITNLHMTTSTSSTSVAPHTSEILETITIGSNTQIVLTTTYCGSLLCFPTSGSALTTSPINTAGEFQISGQVSTGIILSTNISRTSPSSSPFTVIAVVTSIKPPTPTTSFNSHATTVELTSSSTTTSESIVYTTKDITITRGSLIIITTTVCPLTETTNLPSSPAVSIVSTVYPTSTTAAESSSEGSKTESQIAISLPSQSAITVKTTSSTTVPQGSIENTASSSSISQPPTTVSPPPTGSISSEQVLFITKWTTYTSNDQVIVTTTVCPLTEITSVLTSTTLASTTWQTSEISSWNISSFFSSSAISMVPPQTTSNPESQATSTISASPIVTNSPHVQGTSGGMTTSTIPVEALSTVTVSSAVRSKPSVQTSISLWSAANSQITTRTSTAVISSIGYRQISPTALTIALQPSSNSVSFPTSIGSSSDTTGLPPASNGSPGSSTSPSSIGVQVVSGGAINNHKLAISVAALVFAIVF